MYEVNQTTLGNSLQTANPTVFTESTVNLILNLAAPTTTAQATVQQVNVDTTGQVTVPAGTDVALLKVADSGRTTVNVPGELPVVVFESATGAVEVEFNANAVNNSAAVDRVVVGAGGSDIITVKDALDNYIDGGSGNDSITTATGDDSVVGGAGNDSIVAGAGDDTVVAGVGNDTVQGGEGFDVVVATGSVNDYTVTVSSTGDLVLTKSDGTKIETDGVQYIQLDNGEAVVATQNAADAAIVTLYETLLGRTAEAAGVEFWLELADNGMSLTQIARAFLNSSEGASNNSLSNNAFLEQLYQNTLGRASDAPGLEFWLNRIDTGLSTRADIAAAFAGVAANTLAGQSTGEVTTVGYINIITDLI